MRVGGNEYENYMGMGMSQNWENERENIPIISGAKLRQGLKIILI